MCVYYRNLGLEVLSVKVFYDQNFLQQYSGDPASSPGRLDHAVSLVTGTHELIAPVPCKDEDLLLVHMPYHVEDIRKSDFVFSMAKLAAGATIAAAQSALQGAPAFALCRPPGHHASPASCWGFCYFNNIAIAVRKMLLPENGVKKILIVDFDLHFGDGTDNTFMGDNQVSYFHVEASNRVGFVESLRRRLDVANVDMIAVSAGFDRHINDWGSLLETEDYGKMGKILGSYAKEHCQNRIFAALEGGYNPQSLGDALSAFLEGLEDD